MRDDDLSKHLANVASMNELVDQIGCALRDEADPAAAARLRRLLNAAERFYLGAIPVALERSRDAGPAGEMARAFVRATPGLLDRISRAASAAPRAGDHTAPPPAFPETGQPAASPGFTLAKAG